MFLITLLKLERKFERKQFNYVMISLYLLE